MRKKRYIAPDMRQAIALAREELGSDMVILSSRKTEQGTELLAATDYEESVRQYSAMQQEQQELLKTSTQLKPLNFDNLDKVESEQVKKIFNKHKQDNVLKHMEWPEDAALVKMQGELTSIKQMLQNQMSGLAWHDINLRNPVQALLLQRLFALGLSPTVARMVATQMNAQGNIEMLWKQTLETLTQSIKVKEKEMVDTGGVVALVGPTGAGKTTTIAKIAAKYVMRYGVESLALLTTDRFRVAAHNQLQNFGSILGVPVKAVNDKESLDVILESLQGKRLVLIDTAGISQRDKRLDEYLSFFENLTTKISYQLVLPATSQQQVIEECVHVYNKLKLAGTIVTKVDEATSLGPILTALIYHQLCLTYIGTGQHIPDDLHLARPNNLMTMAVSIGKEFPAEQAEESLAFAFAEKKVGVYE